uniref:Calponin-homology (CH) domain-containing protein n=1 Tax=Romanomermis culicivorax TaxID=13658 RepID=A0A915I1T7_ROMCU
MRSKTCCISVLAYCETLKRLGCNVEDHERHDVTETILRQAAPFRENAHLALIDALMITSIRETVSIRRIVEAIKQYSNVHAEEQPNSLEEAVLLWMNRICSVLRDRMKLPDSIPQMTDLYDDLCDGMCLAAILSFYNGAEMEVHRICFNEMRSIADCMHNLHLVQNFCHRVFQPTIFHFGRCEDILYAHECLKINILIFVVELFYKLEEFGGAATSMMNSTDSLMTTKSFDSLKYRSCPTTMNNNGNLTPHATTFADFAIRTLDKTTPEKSPFKNTEDNTKGMTNRRNPHADSGYGLIGGYGYRWRMRNQHIRCLIGGLKWRNPHSLGGY